MTSFATAGIGFGGYILTVPTVATLRNTTQKVARARGDFVCVGGTFQLGDGAGGIYAWFPVSLDNDDGQQTIKPFDVANDVAGRWKWVVKGDSALFTRVTHLESTVNDPVYGLIKLSADIINEITARLQGDEASIHAINALRVETETSFQTTNASITDERTVRTNAVSALATRTSTLEATISDSSTGLAKAQGRITDESTARVTADTAQASRISTLETNVNDPNTGLAKAHARVTDETNLRTTADTALANRTSTLESQVNNGAGSALLSRIATEESTRASQTEALSNRVTTVEASTGGSNIQARVTTTEQAIATINGPTRAFWQVESVAGNNRAQLSVKSSSNGYAGVDIVGDLTVNGNLIVNGSIPTVKVTNNAITDGDSFANNNVAGGQGGITVSSGFFGGYNAAFIDIFSQGYNISSSGVFSVSVNFKQDFSSGNKLWACELLINGNIVDSGWGSVVQDKMPLQGAIFVNGPSTVQIQVRWAAQDNTVLAKNLRGNWQVRYK